MPLGSDVRSAFFPYAKAFLKDPDEAEMRVEDDGSILEGVIVTSVRDFNIVDADPMFRSEMSRAFNRLVRHLAPDRSPFLSFER